MMSKATVNIACHGALLNRRQLAYLEDYLKDLIGIALMREESIASIAVEGALTPDFIKDLRILIDLYIELLPPYVYQSIESYGKGYDTAAALYIENKVLRPELNKMDKYLNEEFGLCISTRMNANIGGEHTAFEEGSLYCHRFFNYNK